MSAISKRCTILIKSNQQILNRIHGKNRHLKIGRKNNEANEEKSNISEIIKLKDELKNCIEREEYEKAAIIRDKIKKLEK